MIILIYSTDVTNVFPWVVTYGIRTGLVTLCGLRDATSQVGTNENTRDLSEGDCDAPI